MQREWCPYDEGECGWGNVGGQRTVLVLMGQDGMYPSTTNPSSLRNTQRVCVNTQHAQQAQEQIDTREDVFRQIGIASDRQCNAVLV
eukprot:2951402-Rhodomonas_salina.1